MSYRVFTRTWWIENDEWPDGLEPGPGKKHTMYTGIKTADEARTICMEWNRTHKPGRLSRKAEFEEV